tara:strand:- start:220 stop:2409 length:2190 start_codon:yes stop_codon:yes gene_type:complete
MKIFFRIILSTISLLFIFLIYLTFIGIETKRLNEQISNKIKNIDSNLDIELKKIKITLSPFNLKVNAKTIGTKLLAKDKVIEIENIKTQISLISFLNNEFSLEDLKISTKSIEVEKLISFIREFYNTPQLFILEKIIKRGYLIADINLNFDKNGKITKDSKLNGFIKDTKIAISKQYEIEQINFIFDLDGERLKVNDVSLNFNDLKFLSQNILIKRDKEQFIINGEFENRNLEIKEKQLKFLLKNNFPNLAIRNIRFNSENNFFFKINNGFKLKDFKLNSDIKIQELTIKNNLNLKDYFPKIKDDLNFLDQNLKINYSKKKFSVKGSGDILIQDKKDKINYSISRKENKYEFKSSLNINDNPFNLKTLNYKKSFNEKAKINIEGIYDLNKGLILKYISLEEKKNKLLTKNLIFNKKFQITDLENIELNYFDSNDQKNLIEIQNKDGKFYLTGKAFNADKLIENLLSDDNQNSSNILNKKFDMVVDIKEVRLDQEHIIEDFNGVMSFDNNKILKAKLLGNFSKDKKFVFTIDSTPTSKVTTLFMDKAKPIIDRYKFIKGFEDGLLDFNSTQKGKEKISTLKIYDFKLKELPALTKILTLASLQGIADILSGEGIRFDEFEMNFRSKDDLITIDEVYAIGPAISIMMSGYIEKNKLISLRGSLVPATTINKAIKSIPLLGEILVGSKTGEGVFGVSFKIKGPPKKLDTTVNPIKTLTPRFITRTLEGLKKN